MAKLKDTTIYGSLDVIKDIRKNGKDVATEDFVEDFVTEQGFLKKDGSVSIEKATSTGDSASKELKFDIKHAISGDITKSLKASALGYLEYDEEVLFSKVDVPSTGNVITDLNKVNDTIKATKETFIRTATKGNVTTGDPGTNADVSVTNSNGVATFNFTIPQGPRGLPGLSGQPGAAATVSVGTTTTGAAGTNASVTQTGTAQNRTFNFVIPKGEQGPPGVDGTDATVTKANIDTALSYATGSIRLGISAGTSSTGNYNTLFGNSAGSSLTTGSANTYIGFESGASNKTSYQNVAIGYRAAHKITSGNDNIILGSNSGESITTSIRNIAIGSFALGKITSSSYIKNIGIGYDAGRFKENGTSSLSAANNSIYIGDSTKGSASSGNNNEIVIGTNAIGKGSNTVQLGSSNITTGYIGNKTIATEEYVDSKEVVLPSNLIRQTNWNSSTKTLTIEVLS